MIHNARDLSPEQKSAAELLLGRPVTESETVSVQAFESAPLSAQRRNEVTAGLRNLFAQVDRNLQPVSPDEAEEIFNEAMRSSRPGYRTHQ